MKKFLLLALSFWLFSTLAVQAQKDHYTYLTDKKFKNSEDLFGYTFVPNVMEIASAGQTKAGEQTEISAGKYKFGITRGNLFVKGEDIDGIHNINQINTTDYGYKLILMNARDPKLQGHLKVIMLKNYVDALVFKADNNAQELVFLLPEIEASKNESEKNFFTDKNEVALETAEDIWGAEIKPFFKVFMPKKIYQRVQKKDEVMLTFIETEKIVDKNKKKDDVVMLISEEAAPEEVVEETIIEDVVEPEPVVEEEDDGMPSYFKVKKKEPIVEEIEEVAAPEQEEIIEEEELIEESSDLFANERELEVAQVEQMGKKSKKEKKAPKDKKIKVVKEYELLINDLLFNDDGTTEPIERRLKIKDWKLREDESAQDSNEVFQLELETDKGPVYIYLSSSRKITKIDCGEIIYLMRGL